MNIIPFSCNKQYVQVCSWRHFIQSMSYDITSNNSQPNAKTSFKIVHTWFHIHLIPLHTDAFVIISYHHKCALLRIKLIVNNSRITLIALVIPHDCTAESLSNTILQSALQSQSSFQIHENWVIIPAQPVLQVFLCWFLQCTLRSAWKLSHYQLFKQTVPYIEQPGNYTLILVY